MIVLIHRHVSDFKSLRSVDLTFPREAGILVVGNNEAGKLTLFESVVLALYGDALIYEETGARGRGRIDTTINYAADSANVLLGLDVDGTGDQAHDPAQRSAGGGATDGVGLGRRLPTSRHSTAACSRSSTTWTRMRCSTRASWSGKSSGGWRNWVVMSARRRWRTC